MKFLVTWKSIAFPDMDLQTCVEADNADAAQAKAEAEHQKILRMSIMLTM